ncbi:hypothetical protein ABZ260_45780, partial [Streptosporangium sp. NPDC006013]
MTTTHQHPTNARRAVSYFFILLGTASGAWAARIPAVKHTLNLSDGQLSYGLLAVAIGLITGMRFAGHLTDRLGSARLLTPSPPSVWEKVPTADLEDDRPALPDEVALGLKYT